MFVQARLQIITQQFSFLGPWNKGKLNHRYNRAQKSTELKWFKFHSSNPTTKKNIVGPITKTSPQLFLVNHIAVQTQTLIIIIFYNLSTTCSAIIVFFSIIIHILYCRNVFVCLQDAAEVCKEYMRRDPLALNFTVVALSCTP